MRRIVGATVGVGLLSTLGLPWVHDETGRMGVVKIFDVGRGASTDLSWPFLVLLLVVVAAVASLKTALRPDMRLLPRRTPVVAAAPPPSPARRNARVALACLAAAGAGAAATASLDGRADVALPTSVVVAGAGTMMWSLLAWWHRRDAGRKRVPGPKTELTAIGAFVAVTVLTVAVGAPWWVEGRHVDATTTGRRASGPSTGPSEVDRVEWSASVDDVLVAGPRFVLRGARGDHGEVSVVDGATGEELWHYRHDEPLDVAVSEPAGVVVVHQAVDEDLTELVGLDLSSGRERWRRRQLGLDSQLGLVTTFGVVGDLLLAMVQADDDYGDELLALDPASGRRLWSIDPPFDMSCPELWRLAGDVLVGLSDCLVGPVVAVDRDSGRTLWELGDDHLFLPTVTTVDGVVLVREYGNNSLVSSSSFVLTGLDARSGRELWRREGRSWPAAPVVTGGRIVTASGPAAGGGPWELQGLVARTGEIAWSQELSTAIPVQGNGDDGLVVGTDGTRVYVTAVTDDVQAIVATFDTDGRSLGTGTFPLCGDEGPCSEGLPVAPRTPSRPDATTSPVTSLLAGGGVLLVAAGAPLLGGTGTQVHGPIVAVGPDTR